jgi:DNA polymerase elongation subunit (family B)
LRRGKDGLQFRVKSYCAEDEGTLLHEFANLLNRSFNGSQYLLCAHNGKEFDFPYLARRMMVHGIALPKLLDIQGKKPWEVQHLDTLELWKFGDRKSFTSLNLLAHLFDIPTPKDDIDGSMVGAVYWQENDLDRIARYCCKDVITLARVFLKFRGDKTIDESDIIYA